MKQTLASMMMLLTLWTGLFGAAGSVMLCIHNQGSVHVLVNHEIDVAAAASCAGTGCTEQHAPEISSDALSELEQDRHCADIIFEASDAEKLRPANTQAPHAPTLSETPACYYAFGTLLDTSALTNNVQPKRAPLLMEAAPIQIHRTTVLRL